MSRFNEAQFREEVDVAEFEEDYSEESLWDKVRENVKSIGMELIYKAFQLYYVTQLPDCPLQVKIGIYGALGYLISPLDFIPDLIPGIGYLDDASVVAAALVMANAYVSEEVKEQARERMAAFFGEDAVEEMGD